MSEEKRPGRPKGRGPYPVEVRDRAVRMVFEHQDEYPSQWKAIESIAAKLAINHETLRQWVRRKNARTWWRGLPPPNHFGPPPHPTRWKAGLQRRT